MKRNMPIFVSCRFDRVRHADFSKLRSIGIAFNYRAIQRINCDIHIMSGNPLLRIAPSSQTPKSLEMETSGASNTVTSEYT